MQAFDPPRALGPYTAWMFGPGRAFDFFASERAGEPHALTGVIERPDGHAPTAAPVPLSDGGLTVALAAPTLWSGLPAPRFVPFVMADTPAQSLKTSSLDALFQSAEAAGVGTVGGGGFGPAAAGAKTRLGAGAPIRTDSLTLGADGAVSFDTDPAVDLSKPLIVVGVIDDGIPFAHRAFGDRVEALWMQGMAPDGSGRVRFGREVTRADIAALRAAHGDDEDVIYRAAGALGGSGRAQSPLIGDGCHGAHTLGTLAAGSDAQVRIIAVDLPSDATWDTSCHGKEALMLAGLHYIFDRADRLAAAYGLPALPMVINLSYGYSGGGHDGQGVIEAAMDELIEARRAQAPTGFTMPAGNMFLDRTHAALKLTAGQASAPVPWRLLPDDRTSSFVEIWLPKGTDASGVTLALHGPGIQGAPGPIVATLDGATADPGELRSVPVVWGGTTVGQLTVDCPRQGRWRFMIAMAPTEAVKRAAPVGLWHIAMTDTREGGGHVTARLRIQRDISYGRGYTGARQSYFDDPDYDLFDEIGAPAVIDNDTSPVKRFGNLSGMATGATSLVIGASKGWGDRAELYSGASSGSDPVQVDASAQVSESLAEMGRLGLSARSGPRHRMIGTSVAAPAVGAALRAVIADAQPGDAASNYRATLDRANAFDGTAPGAKPRLGTGILK